ncbi:MAG: ATP-binding protein, partial [Acidimicrobiia bacterium]|nr:ATP-binding protein [Acidimicrobiia bacterium]
MLNRLTLRKKLLAVLIVPLVTVTVIALVGAVLAVTGVDSSTPALIVGLVGILLAAGWAAVGLGAIRGVVNELDRVSNAAEELAQVRMPQLVEVTTSDAGEATLAEFAGAGDDEVGRLVSALNDIQTTTAGLAGKQHERIRQGLRDLVVNLVRRNQSLLDRQIELIDNLESGEEDPDRLEELFGVDHLATRMRRNAESLLVLAGSEPPRRKGGSISINDLMRVAMGEIEGYQSVHLTRVDAGDVSAQAAFDIAHLLSELLENATHFSPPNSQVEMAGAAQDDGNYLISIADHGIGMSEEQIDQTNLLLADPPELDLDLGRSLGFIVVARLARRLELTVELAPTPGGAGVTALILVPEGLLTGVEIGGQVQNPASSPAEPVAEGEAAQRAEAASGEERSTESRTETTAAGTGGPVVVPAFDVPDLDDGPAWTPPTLPDRGADLGKREVVDEPAAPVESEALARLLGKPLGAPTGQPAEPAKLEPTETPVSQSAGQAEAVEPPAADTPPKAPR